MSELMIDLMSVRVLRQGLGFCRTSIRCLRSGSGHRRRRLSQADGVVVFFFFFFFFFFLFLLPLVGRSSGCKDLSHRVFIYQYFSVSPHFPVFFLKNFLPEDHFDCSGAGEVHLSPVHFYSLSVPL